MAYSFTRLAAIFKESEKGVFLLLIFLIPLQTRVFLWSAGVVGGFNEWQSIFLYATDLLVVALFLLWLAGSIAGTSANRGAAAQGNNPHFVERKNENSSLRSSDSSFLLLRSVISSCTFAMRSTQKYQLAPFLLGIILLIGFVSALFASHGDVGLYRWVKLVEFVGLFLYIGRAVRLVPFSYIALAFVASGLVQSFIAIGQFSLQRSLGLKLLGESVLVAGRPEVAHIGTSIGWYVRAYGTFPSPNVLAAFLSVAIFFLLYLYIGGAGESMRYFNFLHASAAPARRLRSALGLALSPSATTMPARPANGKKLKYRLLPYVLVSIALVLLVFALFLTFSRGVLLAFFVSSVLFFVLLLLFPQSHTQRKRAAKAALLFAMSHLLVAMFMWPELYTRFFESTPTNDAAVTERLFFNEVAVNAITGNPLFGVGPGNFTFFYRELLPDLHEPLYQPVHNILLLIGAELGLVAMFIFIIFIAKILGRRFVQFFKDKNARPVHALFASVLIFIILSGFIDHYYLTIQQGGLLFWLLLGLGYYYQEVNKLKS